MSPGSGPRSPQRLKPVNLKNFRRRFDDCFFSYACASVFAIAFFIFLYVLANEYEEREQQNRLTMEPLDWWTLTFLVMIISGFFVSSYCMVE
jgi:hypothetical protein